MYPNEFRNKPRQDISSPMINRPIQRPSGTSGPNLPQPQPAHLNHPVADNNYESHPKSKLKAVLLWLLVLILIGAAAYGGYYYANYEDKKNQTGSNQSQAGEQKSDENSSNVAAQSNIDTTHFVAQAGYPYDLGGKKKFLFKLGLPEEVQGIGIKSDNSNRGFEKFYTDKYNDELGRWAIGYPDREQTYKSQVSIVAISKSWLGLSQSGNTAFNNSETKLNTPAQKKAYIEKVKADSEKCVKDSAKGFTTQDSFFNVCFSIIPGVDSFAPILVLQGYGEAEKTPMLFVGSISLDDGKIYDDKTSKKLLVDAKEGKLPQSTVDLIATFANSFSKTTLEVTDN